MTFDELLRALPPDAVPILPTLWVGNADAAAKASELGFTVVDAGVTADGVRFSIDALDDVARLIAETQGSIPPMLAMVTCPDGEGIAPMAVAWYLANHLRIPREDAWRWITAHKTEARDQRHWLAVKAQMKDGDDVGDVTQRLLSKRICPECGSEAPEQDGGQFCRRCNVLFAKARIVISGAGMGASTT